MVLELVPKEVVSSEAPKPAQNGQPVYKGMERRKAQRRITVDRREMIRFESTDRRRGQERRGSLGLWKQRDF